MKIFDLFYYTVDLPITWVHIRRTRVRRETNVAGQKRASKEEEREESLIINIMTKSLEENVKKGIDKFLYNVCEQKFFLFNGHRSYICLI